MNELTEDRHGGGVTHMCTMMGTMYPSDLIVVIRVLGRLTGSSVRHVASLNVAVPNAPGRHPKRNP
jgi:hypothetical protein